MTVLVAFTPTPRGEAAFDAGLAEAHLRGEDLLLVNSPRWAPSATASAVLCTADGAEDETVPVRVRLLTSRVGVALRHVIGVDRVRVSLVRRCPCRRGR